MKFAVGDKVKVTWPKFYRLDDKIGTVVQDNLATSGDYRVTFSDKELGDACFYEHELELYHEYAVGDRVLLVRPWSDGVEGNTGIVREITGGRWCYRVERDHDGLMGLCGATELAPFVERDLGAEVNEILSTLVGIINWIESNEHQNTLDFVSLGNRVAALETVAVATLKLIGDEQSA